MQISGKAGEARSQIFTRGNYKLRGSQLPRNRVSRRGPFERTSGLFLSFIVVIYGAALVRLPRAAIYTLREIPRCAAVEISRRVPLRA